MRCQQMIVNDIGSVQLLVPHDRYDLVAKLHTLGDVQSKEHTEAGVLLTGRFPPSQAGLIKPFLYVPPKRKTKAKA